MIINEDLSRFEGGQLEVTKKGDYSHIGKIQKIRFLADRMTIQLEWNAEMRDCGWRVCHDHFVTRPLQSFVREDEEDGGESVVLTGDDGCVLTFTKHVTLRKEGLLPAFEIVS